MGKNLIIQARGKGGPRYRVPSFNYLGEARYPGTFTPLQGTIVAREHCAGHSAPLITINYNDGTTAMHIAWEGLRVNDTIILNSDSVKPGHAVALRDIPEGTIICNIESAPGDGGKFVRSSGTFARIVAKTEKGITILLPSKKEKLFHPMCRATIGIVAGGGRVEKPFVKAGNKYHAMAARNRLWPQVKGQSMNAVDHPHGGKRSSKKNAPTIARRHAPPGANVGMLRPRRTGRKKL